MQSEDSSGNEQDGPSRKRNKRSSRACDNCRKGKTRCDAGTIEGDVCSICKVKGIPCTFVETSKRRAPPKGYIEQLETRINSLEALLNKVAPGLIDSLDDGSLSDLGVPTDVGQNASGHEIAPSTSASAHHQVGRASGDLTHSTVGSKKSSLSSGKKSNARHPPLSSDRGEGVEALADAISDMTIEGRYFGESSTYRLLAQLQGSGSDTLASPALPTLPPGVAASSTSGDHHTDAPTQPRVSIPTPSLAPKTPEDDLQAPSGSGSANRAERSYAEARMESDHAFRTRLRFPVPPVEKCRPLIDLYFQHVHPIFPILHRPSFEKAFQEFIPNDRLRRNEAFATLVFAVVAMGSRFSTDPVVMSDFDLLVDGMPPPTSKQRYAAGYAAAICAFYVSPRWVTSISLWTTQAAFLHAVWHLGASAPLVAWMTVSSAIRSAIDVGMHRGKTRRWTSDHLTDQQRKRTMWALITLDRTLASQLGRNVTLQDGDYDLELPWEIADADLEAVAAATPPTQLAPAITLPPVDADPLAVNNVTFLRQSSLLSIIQTKALRTIYAPRFDTAKPYAANRWEERVIAELDHALHRLQHALPPACQWNDKRPLATEAERFTALRSALLHIDFYSTQILVHRQFVAASRQGLITWPSATICQNAARSMCHTLCYLLQKDLLQWCWVHAPLNATNTATLLLINMAEAERTGQEYKQSLTDDVQRCIDVMTSMQDISYTAYKSVMGLRDLCRSYRGARTLKFDKPSERRRNPSPLDHPVKLEPHISDYSDLVTLPQSTPQGSHEAQMQGGPSLSTPILAAGRTRQIFGAQADMPIDLKQYALMSGTLSQSNNPQSQMEAQQAYQAGFWQAMGPHGLLQRPDPSVSNMGSEHTMYPIDRNAISSPPIATPTNTQHSNSASTTPEISNFSPSKLSSVQSTPRHPGAVHHGGQAMIVPHSLKDSQKQEPQRDLQFQASLSRSTGLSPEQSSFLTSQMSQSSPSTAFHWEDYLPGLPNLPVPRPLVWPMYDGRFALQPTPLQQLPVTKVETLPQSFNPYTAGLPSQTSPSAFDTSKSMQFLPSQMPQGLYPAYMASAAHQPQPSPSHGSGQSQFVTGQYFRT